MSMKNVSPGESLTGLCSNRRQQPDAFIGLVSDTAAFDEARKRTGNDDPPVILISEITQLYDYVTRIPDLAWDLMEFAENPLTLVLKDGKNLPESHLWPEGDIAICLVKNPVLLKHMKAYRQGLFYLPATSTASEEEKDILSPRQNSLILQQEFLESSRARTARLAMDGTIKFL